MTTQATETVTREAVTVPFMRDMNIAEVRNGVVRFENGAEMFTREAPVVVSSIRMGQDEAGDEERLVDVTASSGSEVLRYSCWDEEYYLESLRISQDSIDWTRLNNGAPVLNSHMQWNLSALLGHTKKAWIEEARLLATLSIADTEDVSVIWRKIQKKHIRHVSIGYRVLEWEITRKEGEITRKVATKIEVLEISFVCVGADPDSGTRSGGGAIEKPEIITIQASESTRASETEMTTNANAPAQDAGNEATRNADLSAAAVTADRQRAAQINRYADTHGVDAATRNAAIDAGTSFADFASAHMDSMAERQADTAVTAHRTSTAAVTGGLSPEAEAEARGEALTHETLRSMGFEAPALSDNAQRFVGDGLFGAARFSLEAAGISTANMRDAQVLGRAFERAAGGVISTTDIASIAARPINAVLDNSFRESLAETDYQSWTGVETSTNFHDREAINFGIMKGIRELSELGQMPLGKFGGSGVISEQKSHGMALVISRQALINDNDDLGMFMENVRNTGLIWGPYIQGLAIDALLTGEIITKESGRKSVYVPYVKGKGGNYVEIPALDFDNYETLELAFYDQYHPKALGGGRVRNGKVGEVLVSPDLANKARLIFKEVAGVANPYASENVKVTVIQDLPEGTGFLVPAGRMNKVLKRRLLRGQEGPQMERLPINSFQRIEYETFWDGNFNFSSTNGFIKFKIV